MRDMNSTSREDHDIPVEPDSSEEHQDHDVAPEPAIPIENLEQILVEIPEEDDNETPTRSKRQRIAKSFGDVFIVYLVEDTLKIINEAFASPDADYWKEAIRSEMDSIMANDTWEVVDRSYGCKPVGCKWIFKKKARWCY